MQGIPVQKLVLIENIRIGGAQSRAFSVDPITGWWHADFLSWSPELGAVLVGVKHRMVPEDVVLTVPISNVASMEVVEGDLDRFGQDKAKTKKA